MQSATPEISEMGQARLGQARRPSCQRSLLSGNGKPLLVILGFVAAVIVVTFVLYRLLSALPSAPPAAEARQRSEVSAAPRDDLSRLETALRYEIETSKALAASDKDNLVNAIATLRVENDALKEALTAAVAATEAASSAIDIPTDDPGADPALPAPAPPVLIVPQEPSAAAVKAAREALLRDMDDASYRAKHLR